MANIKTTFDEKSLVIANILGSGETITHAWSINEMYQIVITKGTVIINGNSYDAVSVNDIQPNTQLVVSALTDASFLTLLRSDKESIIDQLLPGDGTVSSYYEYMRDFRPDWFDQGIAPNPPTTIPEDLDISVYSDWYNAENLTVTPDRIKTLVLQGWD